MSNIAKDNNENTSVNMAPSENDVIQAVQGTAKAAAKAASGNEAGAAVETVKVLPSLVKVLLGIGFIVIFLIAVFLQTPALIWDGISSKYSEWTINKAIDVIDDAFAKSSKNVSDSAIDNIEYLIPDFESLRNQYYSDGGTGIGVLVDDDGNTFCVAIDSSGNDVLIRYTDVNNNELTEIRYVNGNNLNTESYSIDYTEVINAFVYSRAKKNDKNKYTYSNGQVLSESENDTSVYADTNDEYTKIWGMTDTGGLYKYINDSDNLNKLYSISYTIANNGSKTYDDITHIDKEQFNNPAAAEANGLNKYYQMSIKVSSYDESIITNNKGDTYSPIVQDLFELTDDEMTYISGLSTISNAMIDCAKPAAIAADPSVQEYAEYFVISPSKQVFNDILNGKSVLQQLTEAGLISGNLDAKLARNLFVQTAQQIAYQQKEVPIDGFSVFGDNNFLTHVQTDQNASSYSLTVAQGESGTFVTYALRQSISNEDDVKICENMFGVSDPIYTSNQYASALSKLGRYYTKFDFTSDNKIEPGDLIFFGADTFIPSIDGSGTPMKSRSENIQVGVVLGVNYNTHNIRVACYNYLGKDTYTQLDFLKELINDVFAKNREMKVFDINPDKQSSFLSGYGKPDFETYAKVYNEVYAEKIAAAQETIKNGNLNTGSGVLGYPVDEKYWKNITATFPHYSNGSPHTGVDFGVPKGSSIYAAEDGVVVTAKKLTYSYGYYIVIKHNDGLYTLYAHNSQLLVNQNDRVVRGQKIALSGDTGNATGPHCHFEVRVGRNSSNSTVNPLNYLR